MGIFSAVTLFSGGGLSALGARDAGFDLVGAVEYDAQIAGVYSDNLGPHVTVGKVEEVCPCPYVGIDALLASPVCTRMSVANANRGETEVDRIAAEGVCRWLRVCRPKAFVMENVTQYRDSDSYRLIMATLYSLGYLCTDDTCNSASWGVPQTRRRMIVRALLGEMPPPLKPTHYNPLAVSADGGLFAEDTRGMLPWVGWYAAIKDILDTLPESKFADWQLARLPQDIFDGGVLMESKFPGRNGKRMDKQGLRFPLRGSEDPAFTMTCFAGAPRAFLCGVQGEGGDLHRAGAAPSPTITTAHDAAKYRALLVSDFTEASGQRVGVPDADTPSATIRAGVNGGTSAKAFLVDGQETLRD